MNVEQARSNMIEQQVRAAGGVRAQDVVDLLEFVKREHFVPHAYGSFAFAEMEIPLPCGENMLKPMIEACILEAVAVKTHEHVLEIGAGSGYMAALLAHRARHVTTVEIEPELKALAENNLAGYDIMNVDVVLGNAANGWGGADDAYDVIVISGSLPALPETFLRQVKVGGRIAAFIGDAPLMVAQMITRTSETAYDTVRLFETNVKALHKVVAPSRFRF
jgi:protein-L-isoaspartate(D-aspartate) O-methyltransferase